MSVTLIFGWTPVAQSRLTSTSKASLVIFVSPPVGRSTPPEIDMPVARKFF
jgi:hypothetical protein